MARMITKTSQAMTVRDQDSLCGTTIPEALRGRAGAAACSGVEERFASGGIGEFTALD